MFNKKKEFNFLENIEKVYHKLPIVKNQKIKKRNILFKKIFFYFLGSFFIFCLFSFTFFVLNFKSAYQELIEGKKNIEYALNLLSEKKFEEAKEYTELAKNNFSFVNNELRKTQNIFFIKYTFLKKQVADFLYLTNTAELLTKAMIHFVDFSSVANEFLEKEKYLEGDLRSVENKLERKRLLQHVYESTPELNGIHANIKLSLMNIDRLHYSGFLFFLKNKIEKLELYLREADKALESAVPMAQLAPYIFGYPEKSSFLILMQNKDELRPTGGFLGTYGILESEFGYIERFDTHDIYHMDMPVKDQLNIAPPKPLKEYLGVDKWFMRDANWSPDWSSSADKIEYFYQAENKLLKGDNQINNFDEKFDGVLAITPDLIIDLLALLGSVVIDGEEYNKDNFMELLQYKVEVDYVKLGVPSWHRKEVIGKIASELKIRAFNQPAVKMFEVFNVINNALLKKDILIKLNNAQLQDIVVEKNWSGNVREVDGDYLMVVDANMASFKTDAVITRNIEYKLKEDSKSEQKDLIVDLKINYAHKGNFDWKTTRYRTYTRVYVPEGSVLLNKEGVEVYDELGKTVFAKFISIEPGELGTLNFQYRLPQKIKNKNYHLLVQKQPGNDVEFLNIDLNFINDITSYSPTGFYVDKLFGSIKWKIDLKTDKEFNVIVN